MSQSELVYSTPCTVVKLVKQMSGVLEEVNKRRQWLLVQVGGFDEDEGGGSPSNNKKGSRSARREGRVKGKGGAEGEPGAAIPGATLRMSEWPPNDQGVGCADHLFDAACVHMWIHVTLGLQDLLFQTAPM